MESPLSLVFLSHTSFLPSLGENYIRIYIPDSLLSRIIRLIRKFLSCFELACLSIFLISFLLIFFSPSFAFVLLFSFPFFSLYPSLLLPFPLPFPLLFLLPFPLPFPLLFLLPFPLQFPSLPLFFTLWFSSLALRAFDSSPPPLWGIIKEYTPLNMAVHCQVES